MEVQALEREVRWELNTSPYRFVVARGQVTEILLRCYFRPLGKVAKS